MKITSSFMRSIHKIAKNAQAIYGWHYYTCLSFAFRCKAQLQGTKVENLVIVKINGQSFKRINDMLVSIGDCAHEFKDLLTIKTKGKDELRARRKRIAAAMQSHCKGGWIEKYHSGSIPEYGLM